ncbi:hypothetical protein [Streptomyces sp. NPDC048720]|uniref:hypothetical protein n=1 Tax=Streptomyces sp. NPDC048720 TaxID=3365588 RepID=UPI003715ACDB
MFEYYFHTPNGTTQEATNDWLQFCADVAKHFGPTALGDFTTELFTKLEAEGRLEIARVDLWDFDFDMGDSKRIQLVKVA